MTDRDLDEPVVIAAGPVLLDADLHVPERVSGLAIFAHGSGSSRMSRRNRSVAGVLEGAGFATLLLDLLTTEEEAVDRMTAQHRFDIPMLGRRVVAAIDWALEQPELRDLPLGLFGASTGAAAALIAAAERPSAARAVVSRGGRPDLAGSALPRVVAPVLLIVGSLDAEVITMNRDAMRRLLAPVELALVPGATHLFEEPGTLATAASLAAGWFRRHLAGRAHREREIPPREWGGFLERFGLRHRAWLASVQEGAEHPLRSVSAERADGHVDAIVVRFGDDAPALRLEAPRALRVEQTPAGEEVGLDVETARGTAKLRFRAAARPEQLDGLAPSQR